MDAKTIAIAAALALTTTPAVAGEGRVVFVCERSIATCELAAQRFEARSRAKGWQLGGRAVALDAVTDDDLALAVILVAIDTPLHRHWLLSIERHEAWDDIPSVEHDATGAAAAIERRLRAMEPSFASNGAILENAVKLLMLDDHRLRVVLPPTPVQRIATLRLTTLDGDEFWSPLDLDTRATSGLRSEDEFTTPVQPFEIDLDTLYWERSISSTWPGQGKRGLPPEPRSLLFGVERRIDGGTRTEEATATWPRRCPAGDYACFMANVASLGEGLDRAEVERRLGPPAEVRAAEAEETWRDTILAWSLHELTLQQPEAPPAWRVEVSLTDGRVVHVRVIGWQER